MQLLLKDPAASKMPFAPSLRVRFSSNRVTAGVKKSFPVTSVLSSQVCNSKLVRHILKLAYVARKILPPFLHTIHVYPVYSRATAMRFQFDGGSYSRAAFNSFTLIHLHDHTYVSIRRNCRS